MLSEYDPDFGSWSAAIEREISHLDSGAVLVGHSIGGTVLIHAVARRPRFLENIAAICLIAAP
jgi:hypothetical protein